MRALHDLPAPAKLNLFLHITGRRADGYHLLQSAFMLIDWCDTLHIEKRAGGQLTREDLGAPLPPDDLVLRAARALQQATGCSDGAHIAIDKQVPAEAGMGGGSSDAATTLLALNRLWGLGLALPALERIGLALGADVPFFLRGHNAWVEGIGEQITPIVLPTARFLVVKPAAGLATQQIFQHPLLKRDTDPAILAGFAANPFGFGANSLEAIAATLCTEVGQALDWLGSRGLAGRMTGSGSAVFALLPPEWAEEKTLQEAPAGWKVRVCGNMEAHPLVGWAPSDDSSVAG
jgi:4-diphosphocytidyl-2-C-methyl-D-erythritol kinase